MAMEEEELGGQSDEKKKSRRIVALSRIDKERLACGEIEFPEEALHIYDAPPVQPQQAADWRSKSARKKAQKEMRLSAREKDILAEVPPHFGKL